jgi:hypothetical protein
MNFLCSDFLVIEHQNLTTARAVDPQVAVDCMIDAIQSSAPKDRYRTGYTCYVPLIYSMLPTFVSDIIWRGLAWKLPQPKAIRSRSR